MEQQGTPVAVATAKRVPVMTLIESGEELEGANTSKVIFFIRHGQSTANAAAAHERTSQLFRDAPLTAEGEQQAASLRTTVEAMQVDAVYCSPLTRAMQTACLAFADLPGTTIECVSSCSEFWPQDPENQGRPLEIVLDDERLRSLPRFADLAMANVRDDWWLESGDTDRIWRFIDLLARSPHKRIAVVTHFGFVRNLMGFAGRDDIALRNCGWIRTAWVRHTLLSPCVSPMSASPVGSPVPSHRPHQQRVEEDPQQPFRLDALPQLPKGPSLLGLLS